MLELPERKSGIPREKIWHSTRENSAFPREKNQHFHERKSFFNRERIAFCDIFSTKEKEVVFYVPLKTF